MRINECDRRRSESVESDISSALTDGVVCDAARELQTSGWDSRLNIPILGFDEYWI